MPAKVNTDSTILNNKRTDFCTFNSVGFLKENGISNLVCFKISKKIKFAAFQIYRRETLKKHLNHVLYTCPKVFKWQFLYSFP